MSWLLLVMGVGGALIAIGWTKQAEQKRRLAWQKVALARDGLYHEPHGFWRSGSEAIEVDIDRARVYLDLVEVGSGHHRHVYTRCRAQYALLLGPIFRVSPEGVLATIGKVLGVQDAVLGVEPAFDQRFTVKCDDPEAVRQVWSQHAMRIMLRSFEKATIRSDGRDIELIVGEGLDVPGLIDEALDLVAEIANADIFGVEALRDLPGAVYHPPSGPWNDRSVPYVVLARPVPVTIAPAVVGRRAVTRAEVGDGPRDRPLKLLVRADGSREPAGGAAQLPPAATAFLRKVGDGTLIVDGARTSFTWLQIETDPERLVAGARLLAALAGAPAQGVYR
jgi:hypothetical protein